ncbi:tubulin-folding cofactor A [Rosa chinensis]|uniref:tubulin-folding cofactor A n=1 Tax=Rosa chinensis TaxID=74649 RepID=UPI000D092C92|nr:tubulin-folding cofactor A [Rosa chinensis]
MATIRNLKIKTGTCKRLVKEFDSYEKEVVREAAKRADMKGKGADPYDLNYLSQFFKQCIYVQAELEEELNQNEGPKIEEARTNNL